MKNKTKGILIIVLMVTLCEAVMFYNTKLNVFAQVNGFVIGAFTIIRLIVYGLELMDKPNN